MKVLVIGSGGREHVLVWKIARSRCAGKIYCAPGNAGIAKIAECIPISNDDIQSLLSFAHKEKVGLTVVGPEAPLALGIADTFRKEGLRIFGPSGNAAQIEASKTFAKGLMQRYGIPTADAGIFTDVDTASEYIKEKGAPIVVKANGLAAGKGVVIASSEDEAINTVRMMMVERVFGEAGKQVIIEEWLEGEEASFLVFTDGKSVVQMPPSQDHKRVFDGDTGPNTGGMGAYSPVPAISRDIQDRIMNDIVVPTINGLANEGCPYEGVLYTGIMLTQCGPKVLEYNCRFGDPEAQPLLMRLQSDIVEIMEAVIDKRLDGSAVRWDDKASVCVVIASAGYPDKYQKGEVITGLEEVDKMNDVVVYHAGTTLHDERIVTAGGRVLGVTALGDDLKDAIERAYDAVGKIHFNGMHYRRDIGQRGIRAIG